MLTVFLQVCNLVATNTSLFRDENDIPYAVHDSNEIWLGYEDAQSAAEKVINVKQGRSQLIIDVT